MSVWGKDGAINPGCSAKCLKRPLTGIKKGRVAHNVADALRRSDDLGVAASGLENTQHPDVKHSRHLG